MTTPRDEQGDKVTAADVCHEHDATDSDRKSNRPSRTTAPRTVGQAPPKWADEFREVWRRG